MLPLFPRPNIFIKHAGWINSVKFNSDGTKLAVASDDRVARIWSLEYNRCVGELTGHSGVQWQSAALGTLVLHSPDVCK